MVSLKRCNTIIKVSSLVGVLLSAYALMVELKSEHDKDYVAMCDFSEHMSCSKAFNSRYGRGFGLVEHIFGEDSILNIPNSANGIAFYLILIVLSDTDTFFAIKVLSGLCALSVAASFYLAFVLYYILEDFCVVCVATYIVNAINFTSVCIKARILVRAAREVEKLKNK